MRVVKRFDHLLLFCGIIASVTLSLTSSAMAQADASGLEKAYPTDIRPLVERFCFECHNAKRNEAEIDLTSFTTWAGIRKHPQIWQKVGEMLDSAQMPPKDANQPSTVERSRLQKWVRAYLTF